MEPCRFICVKPVSDFLEHRALMVIDCQGTKIAPAKEWMDNLIASGNKYSTLEAALPTIRDDPKFNKYVANTDSPGYMTVIHCDRKGKGPPVWTVNEQPSKSRFKFVLGQYFRRANRRFMSFYMTNDIGIAAFAAYYMQGDYLEDYDSIHVPPLEHFKTTGFYLMREGKRKNLIDEELALITGTEVKEPDFTPQLGQVVQPTKLPIELLDFPPVHEELYQNYKTIFLDSLNGGEEKLMPFTGRNIGDNLITAENAPFATSIRRNINPQLFNDHVHKICPLVGVKGKLGGTTSSGKQRCVFPMHAPYEFHLRKFYSKAQFYNTDNIKVGNVMEMRAAGWHAYDITACDKTQLPFLVRLCKETGFKSLVPYVYFKGRFHLPTQMTSGMYGTSYNNDWFLSALMKTYNIRGYKFGDTLLSLEKVENCPYLRYEGVDKVNGFQLTKIGKPKYLRTHNINKLRSAKPGVSGAERYAILYNSYKLMNAVDIEQYAKNIDVKFNGKPYYEWECQDFFQYLKHKDVSITNAFEDFHTHKPSSGNWDDMKILGFSEIQVKPVLVGI